MVVAIIIMLKKQTIFWGKMSVFTGSSVLQLFNVLYAGILIWYTLHIIILLLYGRAMKATSLSYSSDHISASFT